MKKMYNSIKESQDNQVQREIDGREDSNLMTVEYLRARLLSERSVSKAARERAEELAKRVAELEEQLKIVTLKRKKAEKARLDILTFLENHGVSDVSEALDSESEGEFLHESIMGKSNSTMEEEHTCDLNLKGDDKEDVPGFEHESPLSSGRSLLRKSQKDAYRWYEKEYFDSSIRRRTSSSHSDSLPRHRLGKSCQQIKCGEIRSAVDDPQHEPTNPDSRGSDGINCSASPANSLNIGSEKLKKCSENQDQRVLDDLQVSGSLVTQRLENGYNGNMERALEHQAQLIGHFEAQEKAQREWEEKYLENNNITPDSCEHGSLSDVTEDRDETKAAVAQPAGNVKCNNSDQKSEQAAICFSKEPSITHFNGFKLSSRADLECSQGEKPGELHACKSSAPDFSFPVIDNSQTQECLENHTCHPPSQVTSHVDPSHGSPGSQALFLTQSGTGTCKAEAPVVQIEHYALMPVAGSHRLEGVLNSLQQAKILLNQQISSLPLVKDGPLRTAAEPFVSSSRDLDRVKIPVGCAGLFRVPMHVQSEAPSQTRVPGSDYSPGMSNYYPYSGAPLSGGYQYLAGPMEPRASVSAVNQFGCSPASANEYRVSNRKSWVDLHSDSSVSLSREFARSLYTSYPNSMPRLPSNEVFSSQFSSRTAAVPPSDHSSYHVSPNMYRS
ncbi:hypothetical protein Ancab_023661 [Ancistrocladus abbreviatus]